MLQDTNHKVCTYHFIGFKFLVYVNERAERMCQYADDTSVIFVDV